jgi:hypothetical protein
MIGQVSNPPPRGDVLPSMVLAGKTYTAKGGFGLKVGTMKPHAQATPAMSVATNQNNVYFRIENGAYLERIDATIQSEIVAPVADVAALYPTLKPSNLLAGTTVLGVAGNIPIVVGDIAGLNSVVNPGGISIRPPLGYFDGVPGNSVFANLPTLIAANIKTGVSIGALSGTFTADGTIVAGDVIEGKYGYSKGVKITGTMVDKRGVTLDPSRATGSAGAIDVQMPTTATGNSVVDTTTKLKIRDANFIAANIKAGVTVFGVAGTAGAPTDTTATASDVAIGKTVYIAGAKATGTLPDNRALSQLVTQVMEAEEGYLIVDVPATGIYAKNVGALKVNEPNFLPENIASGKSLFGMVGTASSGTYQESGLRDDSGAIFDRSTTLSGDVISITVTLLSKAGDNKTLVGSAVFHRGADGLFSDKIYGTITASYNHFTRVLKYNNTVGYPNGQYWITYSYV